LQLKPSVFSERFIVNGRRYNKKINAAKWVKLQQKQILKKDKFKKMLTV